MADNLAVGQSMVPLGATRLGLPRRKELSYPTGWSTQDDPAVLLLSLYSPQYPSSGETHGLSVVAGAIAAIDTGINQQRLQFSIVDLAARQEDRTVEHLPTMGPELAVYVSTPYGTFPQLITLLNEIASRPPDARPALVVIGGATGTYLWEDILNLPFEPKIVVLGEGDVTAPGIFSALAGRQELLDLPNLAFRNHDGLVVTTDRRLTPLDEVPLPYRTHLSTLPTGTQVFAESSRACSWASCTFCLRGLTDIDGKPREYRRLSMTRLEQDLEQLRSQGLTTITFADEDFLGGPLDQLELFSRTFSGIVARVRSNWKFDASATIRSVFDLRDSEEEIRRRAAVLRTMAEAGLSKVFLGIESGSAKQTRRYNKGHTPNEARQATRILQAANFRVELGFIMFDPLMTMSEIAENCDFLLEGGLAELCSYPLNEMRLQPGSSYLALMHRAERESDSELYNRDVDPSSISHRYRFLDVGVSSIVEDVRAMTLRGERTAYSLKTAARYGDGGRLGALVEPVRAELSNYRRSLVEALKRAATGSESYRLGASDAIDRLQKAVDAMGISIDDNGRVQLGNS